jgi:cobalt-zinc-cadmium resistance protein CzcA
LSNRYFFSGLIAGELAVWIGGSLCYSIVSITISLMNIFGIDANLMSLGAIDFGIIMMEPSLLLSSLRFK